MKVTVTKHLNVRVGEASINAPNYQYLAPGTVLEIDGKVYEGEPFHGNTKWYRDKANNYYWSGGIALPEEHLEEDVVLNTQIDFRQLVRLKNFPFRAIDKLAPGRLKIAVMDSGITHGHPDFLDTSTFLRNSNNNPIHTDENYIDVYGHGTKVSGIIGGRNNDLVGVSGICPDCTLLSIKTLDNGGHADTKSVKSGLEQLKKHPQVTLVNLSFSLTKNAYRKIEKLLNGIAVHKIMVASAGNEEILKSKNRIRNIAKNPNVISVASIPFNTLLDPALVLPKEVDYVLPKTTVISTSQHPKKLYDECIGSSFSTAIITGLIAELMTQDTNVDNKQKALTALNKYCYTLPEFQQQINNQTIQKNELVIIKVT